MFSVDVDVGFQPRNEMARSHRRQSEPRGRRRELTGGRCAEQAGTSPSVWARVAAWARALGPDGGRGFRDAGGAGRADRQRVSAPYMTSLCAAARSSVNGRSASVGA